MTRRIVVGIVCAAAALASCSDPASSPTTPTPPTPTPAPVVEVPGIVRGPSEGETAVYLVAATPLPEATLSGCGNGASGCARRIRMTFRLVSPRGASVPSLLVHLHSDRATACFVGLSGPLDLPAAQGRDVEIEFDPDDTDQACPTPLEITHVAAVAGGSVAAFGRQEWAARYHLVR
jgi:hypothetical protein